MVMAMDPLMNAIVNVATPNDREIVVTRDFAAPADLLFKCHTVPEYVRQWSLGPDGWDMPVCEIDLRVGGGYHYVWRERDGENQFGARGTYREIKAPEHIVHTERMYGFPGEVEGPDGEALCTLTLTESNGKTTLTQTIRFANSDIRDGALASGMTDGMGASYERLEQLVAREISKS